MRAAAAFVGAVIAFAAAGCVGPTYIVQKYEGPPRAAETIAVLRFDGNEPVRLLMLDGERVESPIANDARLHIELLPGPHVVAVIDTSATPLMASPLPFDAAPGKVYRPIVVARVARLYEVDRSSDAPIRDVTRASPERPPPPGAPDDEPEQLPPP